MSGHHFIDVDLGLHGNVKRDFAGRSDPGPDWIETYEWDDLDAYMAKSAAFSEFLRDRDSA